MIQGRAPLPRHRHPEPRGVRGEGEEVLREVLRPSPQPRWDEGEQIEWESIGSSLGVQ